MSKKYLAAGAASAALVLSFAIGAAPAASAGTSSACNTAYSQAVQVARGDYADVKAGITRDFYALKEALASGLAADLATAKQVVDEAKAEFDAEYAKMRANPTAEQGEILTAAQRKVAAAREAFTAYSQNRRAAYRYDRNQAVKDRREALQVAQGELRADIAAARDERAACRKG